MSQQQFQEALAMLIRLPEHNRSNTDEFLAQYQLSAQELKNLQELSSHREVSKFAFKMRKWRFNYILESIPLSLELIDENKLIEFIKDEFDPTHANIHEKKLYRAFRLYLEKHENSSSNNKFRQIVGSVPNYFFDLIKFELLNSEMEFQGIYNDALTINPPLRHYLFETLTLNYSIQEFIGLKKTLVPKDAANLTPKKQKTYLLFIVDEASEYGYQIFEIDNTGVNFLNQARIGINAKRPSYYQDFVDVGLCL